MLKFSANLNFQFQEVPFLDRFQAAKDCGFQGLEFIWAENYQPKDIAQQLDKTGLPMVQFTAFPGNFAEGRLGIAALPHRKEEFKETIDVALSYARELHCKKIHVLSGIVPEEEQYSLYFDTCVENLRYAATLFAQLGITLLVEPMNKRRAPGYMIEKIAQAKNLIAAINKDNVALQFDFYHVQITEGDLTTRFLENLNLIKHIQIAGVPDRNEPNLGEINYSYILDTIEKSGYSDWIGCEYTPKTTTKEGLGWLIK